MGREEALEVEVGEAVGGAVAVDTGETVRVGGLLGGVEGRDRAERVAGRMDWE